MASCKAAACTSPTSCCRCCTRRGACGPLEERRRGGRGLPGRPGVLSDSRADWRSEVVQRLGEAGIECEWRNPNDVIEEPLSSRTYVQTTRILREAISNIIKHSGASHVIISADVD